MEQVLFLLAGLGIGLVFGLFNTVRSVRPDGVTVYRTARGMITTEWRRDWERTNIFGVTVYESSDDGVWVFGFKVR